VIVTVTVMPEQSINRMKAPQTDSVTSPPVQHQIILPHPQLSQLNSPLVLVVCQLVYRLVSRLLNLLAFLHLCQAVSLAASQPSSLQGLPGNLHLNPPRNLLPDLLPSLLLSQLVALHPSHAS
jgi:hypothetical protein